MRRKRIEQQLLDVLRITRDRLAQAGISSAYASREAGLVAQDLSNFSARIAAGDYTPVEQLVLLYAPTGDIQEHSLVGGWADEYLKIANRFETAIANFRHEAD